MQGFFNILKSVNVIHHINKLKNKTYTIISIYAGKVFDTTQHQFMIKKTPQKVSIQGACIKSIYEKPVADSIFNSENLKAFPLRSGIR